MFDPDWDAACSSCIAGHDEIADGFLRHPSTGTGPSPSEPGQKFEGPGLRDGESVYHSYSVCARGLEPLWPARSGATLRVIRPLFPPRIRTLVDAVDYLPVCGFGAQQTVLTVGMDVAGDTTANWYTFDLRRDDGRLLWRHDNHPGHETVHGGRSCRHPHIGRDEEHRVPAEPVTLEDVAAKIVSTHIHLD